MNPVPLTPAQCEALSENDGVPVRLVDAATQSSYVHVPATDYQRLQPLLEDDPFQIHESYSLQEAAARSAGWDDPMLDAYAKERRSAPAD